MSRLQQRRQSHRRRREAINNLRKAGRAAAVIVLLWFMWQLPSTLAYFTDRTEAQSFFRATSFADNLALFPGNSKTNDSPGDPGPAFNVAQIVAGQIYLDFGTYPAGNNRNFPSVLVVTNIGARLLSLNWSFSANLAPFFEQNGSVSIAPGEKATLGFKLDTRPGDQPGEYLGTLYLSALDGFITAELPARLRLAAKKSGKGQQATVNTSVYHDPGAAVSEAVYQSLDSSPPGQEPTGADGLPGVLESVYQGFGGEDTSGTGDLEAEKTEGQGELVDGDTPSGEGSEN